MEYRLCRFSQHGVRCPSCERIADSLAPLDLSPLSKFIGKGQPVFRIRNGVVEKWKPHPDVRHLYIWGAVFDDSIRQSEPEKSPQEKALDDFIAKRKAKRDGFVDIEDAEIARRQEAHDRETERAEALGNAMSKLVPAEKDFRSRLVNVKVEL